MPALSYSIVSLKELKAWIPVTGTAMDDVLDFCRGAATRAVESWLDRRVVFRAPPEVDGAANIVASVVIANGSLTVVQPNSAGRTLIVTTTDADRSVSAGLVTVTGTVGGVAGTTEVFDLSLSPTLYGVKFFTAISGIVVSGLAGNTAGDFIKIGSSLGYVEYHFRPQPGRSSYWGIDRYTPGWQWAQDIWTRERPILNVLEVNEDSSRAFAVGTRLVDSTDYILSRPEGRIVRWSGGAPSTWAYGHRVVKNVYSAGYFTAANVPADIKEVCLSLADRIFAERNREGEVSHSDALGQVTRFSPAFLTAPMQEQLSTYRRGIYDPSLTGEWDFDTEAA